MRPGIENFTQSYSSIATQKKLPIHFEYPDSTHLLLMKQMYLVLQQPTRSHKRIKRDFRWQSLAHETKHGKFAPRLWHLNTDKSQKDVQ
jgi:hypothetical protein